MGEGLAQQLVEAFVGGTHLPHWGSDQMSGEVLVDMALVEVSVLMVGLVEVLVLVLVLVEEFVLVAVDLGPFGAVPVSL